MTILKEIRESCKLSTAELSKRSGVHRRDIYNLEKGKRNKHYHRVLDALAEKVELAYIAGLVDRASCITITKLKKGATSTSKHEHYMARFIVTSVNQDIPEIIKRILVVGEVSKTKSYSTIRDYHYTYYAYCDAAGKALEKLLPYLKIKRRKAEILLEFRELMSYNFQQRKYLYDEHGPGYEWDQYFQNSKYEEFYQKIRSV